jgi:hypothetical protein
MQPGEFAWLIPVVLPLIGGIVLVFALYQLYRLLRSAFRLAIRGIQLETSSAFSVLISFAVSALIMPRGVLQMWSLIYGLLQVAFVEFPRSVFELAYGTYRCASFQSVADQCYFQAAGGIASSIGRFFSDSLRYLTDVVGLIEFFALWAVLVWIANSILVPGDSAPAVRGLRAITADLKPETRQKLALGTIIALGAYLCLCAIVAVSLFKPADKSQILDKQTLEEQLNQTKLDDASFSTRFPPNVDSLVVATKSGDQPASGNGDQSTPGNALSPPAGFEEIRAQWEQFRSLVSAEQNRLLQRALASYTVENLNRVGSREQANHFLALSRWYQAALSQLYSGLDRCRLSINRFRWAAARSSLQSGRSATARSTAATSFPSVRQSPVDDDGLRVPGASAAQLGARDWSYDLFDPADSTRSNCTWQASDISEPPDRSDFGVSLGVMGILSQWLLHTESMPLALITGLVGFGLFGALVSTFVRVSPGETAHIDIFGVLCRGISAAIVVFLAAYGGIAIVSQAGNDPNPYLVFVTCLVGAVFGEDVWAWAKTKFLPAEQGHKPDADSADGVTETAPIKQ